MGITSIQIHTGETGGIRTSFQAIFAAFSSILIIYMLTMPDTPLAKTSTNHESERTPGNKLYPIWLLYFGKIHLRICKIFS